MKIDPGEFLTRDLFGGLKKDGSKKKKKKKEKVTVKKPFIDKEKLKAQTEELLKQANLTEKEKKMVFMLGIIVILAGGFFVIRPMLDNISEMNTALIDLRSQKKDIEQKQKMVPMDSQNVITMQKSIEDKSTQFYKYMESQDISGLITQIMLSYGVTVENLQINMPEDDITIKDYETQLKEGDSSADPNKKDTENTYTGICRADVSVDISSDRERLEYVVNNISLNYGAMMIEDFGIDEDKKDEGQCKMSLSLGIFMVKTEEQVAADAAKKAAEATPAPVSNTE